MSISDKAVLHKIAPRRAKTNGFCSDWGAQIHAGYRSVTGIARISGKQAFDAIRDLSDGKFAVA